VKILIQHRVPGATTETPHPEQYLKVYDPEEGDRTAACELIGGCDVYVCVTLDDNTGNENFDAGLAHGIAPRYYDIGQSTDPISLREVLDRLHEGNP